MKPEVKLDYSVLFKNIDGTHVGYDQKGATALYAVFCAFFFILCITHAIGDIYLIRRNSFHPIVKILLTCLVMMIFSCMFQLVHWAIYDKNGVGSEGCRALGQFLDDASYILFLALLIMIASGWAITYQTLSRRWVLLGLFICDGISVIALYIVAAASSGSDRAATIFTAYEYTQGVGAASVVFGVLYFLSWSATFIYFLYCLIISYREESQYDKRLFYLIFGAMAIVWLAVVPLFQLIAVIIDAWLRMRVVSAIHMVVSFLGYGALAVLLWPSLVYRYFRVISPDILNDSPGAL